MEVQNNPKTKIKFRINTLVISTRDVDQRQRHLQKDLEGLLPHSKNYQKIPSEQIKIKIPQICEERKCSTFICLEGSQAGQLYLWIGKYPNGPSIRFRVDNSNYFYDKDVLISQFIQQMNYNQKEILLNWVKLYYHLIKYVNKNYIISKRFDQDPILKLCREMFISVFKIPVTRTKIRQFTDRVVQFTSQAQQARIWFRHYELVNEDGKIDLSEIGPRFVITPIIILDGCMFGKEIFKNQFELAIENKITIYSHPIQNKKIKRKQKMMTKLLESLENRDVESDEVLDEEYIEALKKNARDNAKEFLVADEDDKESVEEV